MEKTIPWIEKYRPKTLDDLIVDEITLTKLRSIIERSDMPNIIITGMPGIGKTTTILCLAHSLLGKYYKDAVLELNASDDRGIKTVQNTINSFCKKKMQIAKNVRKHKIILLDEADNMTEKAQKLIGNLMEKYGETTRFAFTCNTSNDINETIQTKCIILRYKRINII